MSLLFVSIHRQTDYAINKHKYKENTMKTAVLVLCFVLLAIVNLPALITDYTFVSSMGTYTEISGGTIHGDTANDNQVFNAVPLGFNFNFNGVVYDQLSIAVNGFAVMGPTAINSNTAISSGASNNVVAVCNRDIMSRSTGQLMSLMSGIAPNRVFAVQWKNYRRYPTQCANDTINFQIQLNETTNTIVYAYGYCKAANYTLGQTFQVGLRGAANTEYINRTTTTDWTATTAGVSNTANCRLNDIIVPPTGLRFTWSPYNSSQPPVQATIVYPANGASQILISAFLQWQSGGGYPAGYKLYLGTDNPPTNIVNGTALGNVISYDPIPDLSLNTTYYWQIIPYNAYGDAVSCPIWSFSTYNQPPAATTVISPVNNATQVSLTPDLAWNISSGYPSGYRLYLGTDNPPTNLISALDLGSQTSYTITSPLVYNAVYYWKVVPYNQFGSTATCPVWSFSTPVLPSPAVLVAPANNAVDIQPTATLQWSSGGGSPTGYRLFLGTDNPPTDLANGVDLGLTSTYDPNPNLNYLTTYFWQIIPYNAFGNAPACPVWSFSTPAPPPMIMGNVTMAYNQSSVFNVPVKLYDGTGSTLLQTCPSNEMGEYLFENLSYTDYQIVIDAQDVFVDDDYVAIGAISQTLTVTDNIIQDISLEYHVPAINTSDMTYVGIYNRHEYWKANWETYWHFMRDDFVNRGGHLVTLGSEAESQFITGCIAQHPANYLLGLHYNGTNWYWIDGTPLTYTNWAAGYPSGDLYCSYMTSDGVWVSTYYDYIYSTAIMEVNGLQHPYNPHPVTSFTVQQQRDFTINLSWSNPSEVLCGLSLNSGFDIVIKRNGTIVATLPSGMPGQAMNWQDAVLTGLNTYQIYAVNSYGESTIVSHSVQYGNQVQGVARLNNTSDYTGIKVKFTADPTTPAAVTDSTYTNANGFYSINLPIGRYNIVYSKAGYLDQSNFSYLHSQPTVLPEKELEYVGAMMYLSGSLSGTLTTDYTYIINSQISVDTGNTLVLNPGVRFFFKNGVGFDVNGTLTAIGTVQNPILFSSVTSELRGEMWINNSSSELIRCEFTKAPNGLRINSNARVAYSKFYNVNIGVQIHDNANSDCLFEYNEIYNCTEHAILLYCYGARLENNEVYNNQVSGYILHVGNSYNAQFTSNNVHHNTSNSYMFYPYGSTLTFANNNIEHNTSNDFLFYGYWSNMTMTSNTIEHNTSLSWLLYTHYGAPIIVNNLILNNTCGDLIYLRNNAILDGNTIAGNNGSVQIQDNNSIIIHNTITGNAGNGLIVGGTNSVKNNLVAFNDGYELCYYSSNPSLQYNLFYDTSGTLFQNEGGLPFLLDMQATNANGTACDSYFNISINPQFYDAVNGNYNLLATSPCINAGDPTSALDPDGTLADLGAFYYDMNANTHAQINLPSTLHNFLAAPVGQPSVWNCPVRNTGTDPLIISAIELGNPAFYLASQTRTIINFPLTILPNQTGYIPIGFTPAAVLDYADTLKIHSNALMSPVVQIRLFGSGSVNTNVTLAMPQNTTVNVLSAFNLPLTVSDTTPYNIMAYNMSLSYDPAVFEYISIETTGTLSAEWTVIANSAGSGVLHIGASGVEALSGAGNLFKLNFRTLSGIADGTESYININQVVMNEGGVLVQGCFAPVTIRNIIYGDVDDNLSIQAYDGALALQYSVMMDPLPIVDPRPWVDWRKLRADVSGDGNIYAYDASLILQRVVGLISSFPVELSRPEAPHSPVTATFSNNCLVLSADDYSSLYSLNLKVYDPSGLVISAPQMSTAYSEVLYNQFEAEGAYHLALAAVTTAVGSGVVCSIPVQMATAGQLSILLISNEDADSLMIDCVPTATADDNNLAANFLLPNSPNPFNPSTSIRFGLKSKAKAVVEIYNLKGQLIRTLVDGELTSGNHSVVWNGEDNKGKTVSSGIYFCRTKIGNSWVKTQKMMLMK